jgi:ribose 1,5-bisphosphokinase
VGKDTLIAEARSALAGDPTFVFPRRMVTRQAVPQLEDHDTMSWEDFRGGDFALSWEAHGLGYALSRSVEGDLSAGRTVVVNVSRKVIEGAAKRYPCGIVVVTADPEVRASRLAGRGRESPSEVAARLARDGAEVPVGVAPVLVVDNSGALEPAALAFVVALRDFSARA